MVEKSSSYLLLYSENFRPLPSSCCEANIGLHQPALSDGSIKFCKMFIPVINSFCLAVEWLHIQTYFYSLNTFSFLR